MTKTQYAIKIKIKISNANYANNRKSDITI